MVRVIVTGFEPIWGLKKTPSGELAKTWASGMLQVAGVEVKGLVLPQVFGQSFEALKPEIQSFQPDFVLMYGATQHDGPIRFERFAVNVMDTIMGDNTRRPVKNASIVPGGPAGYESNLPLSEMVDYLKTANVQAAVSFHAGTHTCNEIYYQVMHWLAEGGPEKPFKSCFIHCAFSNEFGVIEDREYAKPGFGEIVRSSVETIQFLAGLPA